MERYGDAVAESCFRATRNATMAFDVYGEVWAEAYRQLRLPRVVLPERVGPWLVRLIGPALEDAAKTGRVPTRARSWMGVPARTLNQGELARLERLRAPGELREARERLPGDLSAAADIMLLQVPPPHVLQRISLSNLVAVSRISAPDRQEGEP